MRKRSRIFALILLAAATAAFGQQEAQSWQGMAAVARSGEFVTAGLFAASNAFAENTGIVVRNAETGQSIQVTVVRRVEGAGNIFLLLSEEAGKQIGISGSDVIRVQASMVSPLEGRLSESLRDEAYTTDPDLNPALSVSEEQLLAGPEASAPSEKQPEQPAEIAAVEQGPADPVAVETVAAEEAEQEAETTQTETELAAAESEVQPEAAAETEHAPAAAQPEKTTEPVATEPAVVAQARTDTPTELSPEQQRLQELADRIPQKQLYMPPRQQEVYALAPEAAPVEQAEELAAAPEEPAEQPEVEQIVDQAEAVEPVAEVEQVEEQPAEIEAEPMVAEQPELEQTEQPEEGEDQEIQEDLPPRLSMVGPEVREEPLELALPGPEAVEPEKPSPEGTRPPVLEQDSPLAMTPEEPPTTDIEESQADEMTASEATASEATASEDVETPVEQAEEAGIAEPREAETALVARAAEPPESQAELADSLPPDTYFVQLGAYSTQGLAQKLAGDLNRTYSVTILPASSGGRRFYKVLVGPLNVDESGTLLYQFRSRGFKDAFIQYIE